MKKISIIMPVYGDTFKYLKGSIRFIKEQDWKNKEIIIVLDGPNEEARHFFTQETELMEDVIVTECKHGGAPVARNYGSELATGDYLTFIDPDVYLYPGTLRDWAEALDDYPEYGFVYGHYDIVGGMQIQAREFNLRALRSTNYISGASMLRKEIFPGWTPGIKSLQDWDLWLKVTDNGHKGLFINKSFFVTEPPGQNGGISQDSTDHWEERYKTVRDLHGIKQSDIVVTSLGAERHGLHVADKLDCDYLPMPSWRPHKYDKIYLLGFYSKNIFNQGKLVADEAQQHFWTFMKRVPLNGMDAPGFYPAKKVIHWIGTDIYNLRHDISWAKLKFLKDTFEKNGFIHLCEAKHTQQELEEVGIKAKVVPIPPKIRPDLIPLPKEFAVAVYDNPTQNMYYIEFMRDIAKAMPDIKFYFYGNDSLKGTIDENIEHVGYVDMNWLLERTSALVRVTVHDGLPLAPLEFMMAGRNVASNVPMKHALKVKVDREDIIEKIREMQDKGLNKEASEYWRKELDPDKFRKTIEGL